MLNKLVPRQRITTIYELDLAELWAQGFRGIITDLDNTLVGATVPLATPELVEWLAHLADSGFKVVIVSNNSAARVSKFAEPLGLPFVYSARKPANAAFHRAMAILDLPPESVIMLGDQMLTDVLGGNRLGLYTVLVQPVSLIGEGIFTRINRRVEKLAMRLMRK